MLHVLECEVRTNASFLVTAATGGELCFVFLWVLCSLGRLCPRLCWCVCVCVCVCLCLSVFRCPAARAFHFRTSSSFGAVSIDILEQILEIISFW